jgi:acyl-CoA thioester hydrolase
MFTSETQIRVRYGETDKMGVVYYGNYAMYFEVGRTESIRKWGLTYRKLEEENIIMPVVTLNVKYHRPACYDDLLTIKTIMKEMPSVRIEFFYEIFNEKGELIAEGNTTLVFIDAKTRKPRTAPNYLLEVLQPFFT